MKPIKTILILALGAVMLPSPPPEEYVRAGLEENAAPAGGAELALAAMRAADDIGGFCARQPLVCKTATRTWRGLEVRLKYSVRLLYEWANGARAASARAVPAEAASRPSPAAAGEAGGKAQPAPQKAHAAPRRAAADGIITGAVTKVASRNTGEVAGESENTLRIEDLLPPWNGPATG